MAGHESGKSFRRQLAGGILGSLIVVALAFSLWWLRPTPAVTPPTTILSAQASVTIVTKTTTLVTSTPPTTGTRPTISGTPPTTTGTPPTTTGTTLAPLVMSAYGLGAARLGDPYDETVQAVAERLGKPNHDSGWIPSDSSQVGTCPGTIVRVVQWHSLRLYFSDGPTEFGEDTRHFFYYNQSIVDADQEIDLATEDGIRLGSTVKTLRRIYGDSLTIDDSVEFGISFVVDTSGSSLMSGTLTSASPEGLVTSIGGGYGCGG